MNSVIIFGASGMGKAALEIFQSNGVVVFCFLSDEAEQQGTEIGDIAVMGPLENENYLKYIGKKCEAFVAIDDNKYRKNIVGMLNERRKVMPINAVHKNAEVASSASIGHGNFINSGVTIGAGASIGNHCIINTNATIDYEARLKDFVQIGAGTIINSNVEIEEGVFVGSGVTIISGVKVGKNARIGAGSVVIGNVKEGQTVFGNPAKEVLN